MANRLPKTNRIITSNSKRRGLAKSCYFCHKPIEEYHYFSHLSGGSHTDKDFGELVFRLGRPTTGVVLLRDLDTVPQKRLETLINVMAGIVLKVASGLGFLLGSSLMKFRE